MIANYHTHTPRCLHAQGTEEEYVRRALEGGFQILGFADHSPQIFPGDYYSTMRMRPEELTEYADAVDAVRKQFSGQIQIHTGLEAEYYPAFFPDLIRLLKDSSVEYLILGQHWPGNEINERHISKPTEDESVLQRYCRQVMDAMYTGQYTYIAHPDVVRFVGDDKVYQKYMREVCRTAKACGIPLEINMLGVRENRNYPDKRFWQVAGEEGCVAILGSDAHRPEHVWDPETEQKALTFAKQFDLEILQTCTLRAIG